MPDTHITGFNHVALLVSDLERSAHWYSSVLGWKERFSQEMPSELGDANGFTGRPGRIALGELQGVGVELVQMEVALRPWERNPDHGLFLISVRVDDIDWAHSHCEHLGVDIRREVAVGAARCLVVADPDGQEVFFVGPAGSR